MPPLLTYTLDLFNNPPDVCIIDENDSVSESSNPVLAFAPPAAPFALKPLELLSWIKPGAGFRLFANIPTTLKATIALALAERTFAAIYGPAALLNNDAFNLDFDRGRTETNLEQAGLDLDLLKNDFVGFTSIDGIVLTDDHFSRLIDTVTLVESGYLASGKKGAEAAFKAELGKIRTAQLPTEIWATAWILSETLYPELTHTKTPDGVPWGAAIVQLLDLPLRVESENPGEGKIVVIPGEEEKNSQPKRVETTPGNPAQTEPQIKNIPLAPVMSAEDQKLAPPEEQKEVDASRDQIPFDTENLHALAQLLRKIWLRSKAIEALAQKKEYSKEDKELLVWLGYQTAGRLLRRVWPDDEGEVYDDSDIDSLIRPAEKELLKFFLKLDYVYTLNDIVRYRAHFHRWGNPKVDAILNEILMLADTIPQKRERVIDKSTAKRLKRKILELSDTEKQDLFEEAIEAVVLGGDIFFERHRNLMPSNNPYESARRLPYELVYVFTRLAVDGKIKLDGVLYKGEQIRAYQPSDTASILLPPEKARAVAAWLRGKDNIGETHKLADALLLAADSSQGVSHKLAWDAYWMMARSHRWHINEGNGSDRAKLAQQTGERPLNDFFPNIVFLDGADMLDRYFRDRPIDPTQENAEILAQIYTFLTIVRHPERAHENLQQLKGLIRQWPHAGYFEAYNFLLPVCQLTPEELEAEKKFIEPYLLTFNQYYPQYKDTYRYTRQREIAWKAYQTIHSLLDSAELSLDVLENVIFNGTTLGLPPRFTSDEKKNFRVQVPPHFLEEVLTQYGHQLALKSLEEINRRMDLLYYLMDSHNYAERRAAAMAYHIVLEAHPALAATDYNNRDLPLFIRAHAFTHLSPEERRAGWPQFFKSLTTHFVLNKGRTWMALAVAARAMDSETQDIVLKMMKEKSQHSGIEAAKAYLEQSAGPSKPSEPNSSIMNAIEIASRGREQQFFNEAVEAMLADDLLFYERFTSPLGGGGVQYHIVRLMLEWAAKGKIKLNGINPTASPPHTENVQQASGRNVNRLEGEDFSARSLAIFFGGTAFSEDALFISVVMAAGLGLIEAWRQWNLNRSYQNVLSLLDIAGVNKSRAHRLLALISKRDYYIALSQYSDVASLVRASAQHVHDPDEIVYLVRHVLREKKVDIDILGLALACGMSFEQSIVLEEHHRQKLSDESVDLIENLNFIRNAHLEEMGRSFWEEIFNSTPNKNPVRAVENVAHLANRSMNVREIKRNYVWALAGASAIQF
ncbi:hypothetical protein K1X76_07075 [bacterium]|nr:hypothetical protein [bacterium]